MEHEPTRLLKFIPFESHIDPFFWYKFAQLKLEVDKLDEPERDVWGFYLMPKFNSFIVDVSSFNSEITNGINSSPACSLASVCSAFFSTHDKPLLKAPGTVLNLNTSSGLKAINKTDLIKKHGNLIKADILSGEAVKNPSLLQRFLLLTYANLKSYEFLYWFAFPACLSVTAVMLNEPISLSSTFSEGQVDSLLESHKLLPEPQSGMFGVLINNGQVTCITLEDYIFRHNEGDVNVYLAFLDPSHFEDFPGWPLRNLLSLIHFTCPSHQEVKVLCLKLKQSSASFREASCILHLQLKGPKAEEECDWVGWETNQRDKFGPRSANLASSMSSEKIAEESAYLNLKLMKWRLVPDIDLSIIEDKKYLILGSGALGCAVARMLLGWGGKHITFVDKSKVSHSNPVRQSLFDKEVYGVPKAKAAAEKLITIHPCVLSKGVELEIPMPGHSTSTIEEAQKLKSLVESHDVVFLLTDTRESRWFPTLLATLHKKIAITAALGYDSYLVMRHGVPLEGHHKLGCYFCNDVTAPGSAKEDRTLDQQCTVTRPGVASIASALAVELMVSLLQHKDKGAADKDEEGLLGILPHSIRGFLASYTQILPATPAFSQCTACSQKVVDGYQKDPSGFLKEVFNSHTYLEDLTGLTHLHKLTDDMEVLAFSDENESDGEAGPSQP